MTVTRNHQWSVSVLYRFLLTLTDFLTSHVSPDSLHLLSSVSTVAVVPLVHAPVISICFDLKEI